MKPKPLTLETERLILRPFTIADIDPSYEMNLDAEVSRYTGDGGVVSITEIERRIKDHVMRDYKIHGFGRLAVIHKADNRFIGFAGLKYLEDLKEVDLGYRFMQKYWGKGLATEAGLACLELGFSTLGLSKIIAMVLPANGGSIRVLEKLKFTYDTDIEEDGIIAKLYVLTKERYYNTTFG